MVDITDKSPSLREAVAQAIIQTSRQETIDRVLRGDIPKGNVFEMAKAAGLLGIKKTALLLPDCHPMPIEFAGIEFQTDGLKILVRVTVKTIYKTGVEVEAMHGASIVALTVYDMLKPVDPQLEITSIKLLEKRGGKSSRFPMREGLEAEIVVCSDSVSRGESEDRAGQLVASQLSKWGLKTHLTIIPDDREEITRLATGQKTDLLVFVGGTGVGPRDITAATVRDLIDTDLPGVEEQMRRYGQDRTPYAMLGRPVAGIRKGRLILSLPGSARGASECVDSVFPHLLHVFDVLKGKRHE